MNRNIFVIILILLLSNNFISAQLNSLENLEEFEKKGFIKNTFKGFIKGFTDFGEPFQLGGSLALNMRSYDAFGGPLRQDPFFYSVAANLNTRIYQIDLPISIVLTAKNTTHSYPSISDLKESLKDKLNEKKKSFARVGMSPYYKWTKLHLGHRAMFFSKYTMNNINFFGAGVELTPDKLRFGAMYGRLAKAEPIDLSLATPNLPIYRRIGWGARLGYGDDLASADIEIFSAKDDLNSIDIPADYPKQTTAEGNVVIGVQLQKLFLEKIRVKLDYNVSAVSPNALDDNSEVTGIKKMVFNVNNTTNFGTALEGSVSYEGKKFTAGAIVNRVGPEYKSLGAYFFNRDILDVQGFGAFSFLDGKLNTNLKAGIQTNNLDEAKPSTTKRFIYDVQASWSVENLNVSGNYSNNTSSVGYVLNQNLDSLNAVIVTNDAGLNVNYSIPTKSKINHNISLTGNIQNVSDDIEKASRQTSSRLMLASLSYALSTPSKWMYSLRANYSKNTIQNIKLDRTGFGLGIKKAFDKPKISIGLDGNLFNNSNELNLKSRNIITQLSLGWGIAKGLGLQIQWGILNTTSDSAPTLTESMGNFGLQYQFSYSPKKKSN